MEIYENAMVEARVAFANRMNKLVNAANAENLGFFLIYYTAFSAMRHAQMGKVLQKAWKRCKTIDFLPLSDALQEQAQWESLQHKAMAKDLDAWIACWNQERGLDLSAKKYLRYRCIASLRVLQALYQKNRGHLSASLVLVMLYEMQRADMIQSVILIELTTLKLGPSVSQCLGFLRRATKRPQERPINKALLARFLQQQPTMREPMIKSAQAAMTAYADFLEDCFKLADSEAIGVQECTLI